MAYDIESPEEIERIARLANYMEAMREHFGPSFDARLKIYISSFESFLFQTDHNEQLSILGQVVHFLIHYGDWEPSGKCDPETSEQYQAQGDT